MSDVREHTVWADLKESLRGTNQDFTEGPIGRAILLLAVPMVLEMVMESVFAVVDIFWVSRLGAEAIAGVGLTESLLTVIYTVAVGLSIGVTAMVARRTGEKDPEAASRTTAQSIVLGLSVAAVLGVIGVLNASRFLGWMGGSEDVVAAGTGYATIMLGSNGVILLLFLINAGFKGGGRRYDRHARPMDREHNQPDSGPAAHLRDRPVPRVGRGGGRRLDRHRAGYGRVHPTGHPGVAPPSFGTRPRHPGTNAGPARDHPSGRPSPGRRGRVEVSPLIRSLVPGGRPPRGYAGTPRSRACT